MIKTVLLSFTITTSVICQEFLVNWRPTGSQLALLLRQQSQLQRQQQQTTSKVSAAVKRQISNQKENEADDVDNNNNNNQQDKKQEAVKVYNHQDNNSHQDNNTQQKAASFLPKDYLPVGSIPPVNFPIVRPKSLIVSAQAPLKPNLMPSLVKLIAGDLNDVHASSKITDADHFTSKCPVFAGARNNDFENMEGLWFKIEAVPELLIRTVCSFTVYQLTSKYTNKVVERLPDLSMKCHNDGSEIVGGDSKRVHQSAMITQTDTSSKTWLTTVLVSDYQLGFLLLHKCNVNNPNEQIVEIVSRYRHLDSDIVDELHQYLIDNGLANLEALIAVVPQDLKYCQNCLNTYIINKSFY